MVDPACVGAKAVSFRGSSNLSSDELDELGGFPDPKSVDYWCFPGAQTFNPTDPRHAEDLGY